MRSTPWRVAFRRPWPSTDRGFILWLFSIAVILIGAFNYLLSPPPQPTDKILTIPFDVLRIPPHVWGGIFIASGLFAAFTAYCHLGRDRWGYTALTTLTGWWSLCFLAGAPLGGSIRGIGGAAIYGLMALILYKMAGLRDEPSEGRSWS